MTAQPHTTDYYRDVWPHVVALVYDVWHAYEAYEFMDTWIPLTRREALQYRGDTMTFNIPQEAKS